MATTARPAKSATPHAPIRFEEAFPASRKVGVAGPHGMTFVAVGAAPGSYVPRGPF